MQMAEHHKTYTHVNRQCTQVDVDLMPHAGKPRLEKAITSITLGCVICISADSHCHGNSYLVSALSVLAKKGMKM